MCLWHLKWGMHFLGELPAVHYCWGPPAVLSMTGQHFYLVRHATVSNPSGTRERALGHRVPQHQPDPPHPGVPGGGAPVAGDTPNLPLCLPQVLTSWTHHLAPSHPARLAGATGGLCLSWHPFLGYPSDDEGALPSKKVTCCFCWEGLEDWAHPLTVPLWWEVTWGPSTVSTPSGSPWCDVA